MNVTCPNCATIYRVDPAKVPEGGVRARCNVCSAVFAVKREGDAAAARPEPAAAAPSQTESPQAARPNAPPRSPTPEASPVPGLSVPPGGLPAGSPTARAPQPSARPER